MERENSDLTEKTRLVPAQPAVIILESPKSLSHASRSRKCMACQDLFRISEAGYTTIQEMRRIHHLYLVLCYGCFVDIRPRLPIEARGTEDVTFTQARDILGLG